MRAMPRDVPPIRMVFLLEMELGEVARRKIAEAMGENGLANTAIFKRFVRKVVDDEIEELVNR